MDGKKLMGILCEHDSHERDADIMAAKITKAVLEDDEVRVHGNLSLDGLKEGYDLAERDNSALRKLLLWIGQRLPESERRELATKIREVREKDVGDPDRILENLDDEAGETLAVLLNKADRVCDLVQEAVEKKDWDQLQETYWFAVADQQIGDLRACVETFRSYGPVSLKALANDLSADPAAPEAVGIVSAVKQIEHDAARWRALLNSPFIRLRGSCQGFTVTDTDVSAEPDGEHYTLGVEFSYLEYTQPIKSDLRKDVARKALVQYADILRKGDGKKW